jgi:hypothetical protein
MARESHAETTGARTSAAHTLPEWEWSNLGANKLGLCCPRCECKTIVNKKRWLASSLAIARPCPYCFKANLVPEKLK